MALLTGQEISGDIIRSYGIHVPDDPVRATVPAIVVFHGGGQDVTTIAARWGVDPPEPVPAYLADYLLVFPESDPRMGEEWVHLQPGDSGLPTLDLDFVQLLVTELTKRAYETASATFPTVSADPDLVYAAGFSNGGGMVWQLLNSALSSDFRGFAAVGKALDPEKARHYRCELAGAGAEPAPAPVVYVQGTADRGYRPPFTREETALGMTLPAFTVREMLERNASPPTRRPRRTCCRGAPASPRWSCSSSRERRRSWWPPSSTAGTTGRRRRPTGTRRWPTTSTPRRRSSSSGAGTPDCRDRSPAGMRRQRHGMRTILPRVWRRSSSRYASRTSASG
jgi:hypothetical protein